MRTLNLSKEKKDITHVKETRTELERWLLTNVLAPQVPNMLALQVP